MEQRTAGDRTGPEQGSLRNEGHQEERYQDVGGRAAQDATRERPLGRFRRQTCPNGVRRDGTQRPHEIDDEVETVRDRFRVTRLPVTVSRLDAAEDRYLPCTIAKGAVTCPAPTR